MLDIDKKQYSARKEYEYDDDIAVLFYKGTKVAKATTESFRKSWVEESWNCDANTLTEFLGCVCNCYLELDEADDSDTWEHIWDELEWNKETKSYKYGNWELVILDI